MKGLPRPVKTALAERNWDAEVTRGWARLQIKRRVRGRSPVVPGAVAMAALLAGAVVWVASRPSLGAVELPSLDGLMVSAPPARVMSCVEPPPLSADAVITVAMSTPLPRVRAKGRQAPLVSVRRQLPLAAACTSAPSDPDVVGELLAGADDAWQEKDLPRMEALLVELTRHHEEDSRAAQALFLLGRLQLEYRHDPASAAASFHRALELDPPAELVGPLWQAFELASER